MTEAKTPVERRLFALPSVGSGQSAGVTDTGVAGIAAAVGAERRFADTSHRFANHPGTPTQRANITAKRLGINAARTIYSLNDGNMPRRKRLPIADVEMRAVLIAGEGCVPNRANEPTGVLERGSWRQARDRWGSAHWVETDERSAPQIAFCGAPGRA